MAIHETAQSQALRRIAREFRVHASETDVAWFSSKMNDAADELDVQAFRIEDADAAHQAALAWH